MNAKRFFTLIGIAALAFMPMALAQEAAHDHEGHDHSGHAHADPVKPIKWDKETLEKFSTLPIQDGGRVKPLSTYAGFKLLKLNGRRECRNLEGEKLTPMAWFLDTLLYPETANQYKVFLVQSSEVLEAIGVSHEGKKKRDRYSYEELLPGRAKLFELAQSYSGIDAKDRTGIQTQIVNLASNIFEYESVSHYADFARHELSISEGSPLRAVLPEPTFSAVLEKATTLRVLAMAMDRGMDSVLSGMTPEKAAEMKALFPGVDSIDEATRKKNLDELQAMLNQLDAMARNASELALFPPAKDAEDQTHWYAAGEVAEVVFGGDGTHGVEELKLVSSFEQLVRDRAEPEKLKAQLASFHDAVTAIATTRGEYAKIPIEVTFYRADFFYNSLILFIIAFAIIAVTWLVPYNRLMSKLYPLVLFPPTALLITGIVFRCIIRGRPPVSTLYETILFITAVAVVVTIFIEYINRQKIALSVGAILGMIGMFLAFRYEAKEGVDTMPSLVAVLDTNFWLATHVTTVTMGYSAGLLAAAIAHIYIIGRFFGIKKENKDFYKGVTRMVYGVLCFGLIFATIGTVLGGIWANESWGRFWGWDPKENGALLIVLCQLAILHARMGGYIRDLGINISAVFGAIVVGFSWWGVNLLGVGLHSYGFTSGILQALTAFYAVECLVILLGFGIWLREQWAPKAASPDATTQLSRGKKQKKTLPAKASK
ncbi:MAG: cytochrome c biogenesis protein CcsA [Candidatus Hydrogenedentes bacterium]|nr:cytochrome c biogenesis protein CcsA [Candidatus Hydrogenedentota bacterium]